ncbi:MAG: PHP domain-containing protein [Gammaproteobacteria bacterium]|nr:PHP domain-containing protein [Gammaproteobacteria bacterium]
MKKTVLPLLLCLPAAIALGHGVADVSRATDETRRIEFPNTAQYTTVVLDPHTHSSFSDGHVWPRIRIEEALRDGLDAIAITEHLEYQPHLADVPHANRNRAFEEANAAAVGSDLLVINGAEITRDAPAGHINAIFIEDANALLRAPKDVSDVRAYYQGAGEWPAQQAVEAANAQGAFVFWNHPYWGGDVPNGITVMPPFHSANAKAGLLHGIEIANGNDYSAETFQIALDHNLTLMGVSDVHDLIDWDYEPHRGGHRPVTLVFAKDKTPASIREALFDKRTVVWFKNLLIGRAEQLDALIAASLSVTHAHYPPGSDILRVAIANVSDARFQLSSKGPYTFFNDADVIEVPPHETVNIAVKTGSRMTHVELPFEVINALTAPGSKAAITLRITPDPA